MKSLKDLPADAPVLPTGHSLRGVSSLVRDGEVVAQWVKTTDSVQCDITAEIVEALKGHKPATSIPTPSFSLKKLATVYLLSDWHIGLLAWGREVGKDHDSNIARKEISSAMARLFSLTPPSEQCVILGLGDLLHFDGYEHVTPASKNRLDGDGRYPRVLKTATDLCLETIDMALTKHKRVLVRILPGNHDEQSAIAVSLALSMHYKKDRRITVDDSPSRYWWWRWGSVLLGATHGDKAKMAKLPGIMASSCPEDWGVSTYRHIYTGHIHTQTGLEIDGVTVESFQSPTGKDAWHHQMGYTGQRSLIAITHHSEHGECRRDKVML